MKNENIILIYDFINNLLLCIIFSNYFNTNKFIYLLFFKFIINNFIFKNKKHILKFDLIFLYIIFYILNSDLIFFNF